MGRVDRVRQLAGEQYLAAACQHEMHSAWRRSFQLEASRRELAPDANQSPKLKGAFAREPG